MTTEKIKKMIYTVRGKQVLLDSDVAILYHYDTKNINKAMKRNIERFPEDFCFQLTKEELYEMWFHNGTTFQDKNIKYRSEKYLPYVYTEQGISMLAGILKNDIAINVSINIIRAFIEMRKIIMNNSKVLERLISVEYKLLEHDKKFEELFNNFSKEDVSHKIFYKGQIYDAYILIIDIIKKAKNKISIIDNYIDDTVLNMLTKKNKHVKVLIFTSEKSSINNVDIKKFDSEYEGLKIFKTNKFYDRFIIIDNLELYHLGASIKDLGKKCFAINKIKDKKILETFLEELK